MFALRRQLIRRGTIEQSNAQLIEVVWQMKTIKKLLRFQLRTFLIIVGLIGCFGGWLAGHEYAHRKEMRLIKEAVGPRMQPATRNLWFKESQHKLGVGIYDDVILG